MKIIAVMSPKGGIGKTTTADSIAYILGEEHGKRVLVLDGDPQGDTSKTFGAYEPEGIGLSELLERHVNVGGSMKLWKGDSIFLPKGMGAYQLMGRLQILISEV